MRKPRTSVASSLALAAALSIPGCSSEPLPEDKAAYVGQWRGDGVDLTITSDGGCSYVKVSGSGKVEVNAPIQEFDGDDFIVGVWIFDTTFDVESPPQAHDGVWTMTVDGSELTRVAP